MKMSELFIEAIAPLQSMITTIFFGTTFIAVLKIILEISTTLPERTIRKKQQEIAENTNNKFNHEVISMFRSTPKMYEALKKMNSKYSGNHSEEIESIFVSIKSSGFIENTHYQYELSEKFNRRIRELVRVNLPADTTSQVLDDLKMEIEKFNKTFWSIDF